MSSSATPLVAAVLLLAAGLSLVSSQLVATLAKPAFWRRFRSGPVLT